MRLICIRQLSGSVELHGDDSQNGHRGEPGIPSHKRVGDVLTDEGVVGGEDLPAVILHRRLQNHPKHLRTRQIDRRVLNRKVVQDLAGRPGHLHLVHLL